MWKEACQGFRAKRIRLTHPERGTLKRGISGVLTETVYYIWRGNWTMKRAVAEREILGGTTWDDGWQSPATAVLEPFTVVPFEAKEAVFDEIWAAREGIKDGSSSEGDDDADAARKGQKKKREETATPKKDTPKKSKAKAKAKDKGPKKNDGKDAGSAAADRVRQI